MTERTRRLSLRTCLALILLISLAPTLAVVGFSVLRASHSYRAASENQLLETARIVANSVQGEIDSAARMMAGYAGMERYLRRQGFRTDEALRFAERYRLWIQPRDGTDPHEIVDPVIREVVAEAEATGKTAVSNLQQAEGGLPWLVVAARDHISGAGSEISSLVLAPRDLVQVLDRQLAGGMPLILAVTDGNGRILARSRDGAAFVGRPVPDWDTLQALGTRSGTFEAVTIEGNAIKFAFQKIEGTPGWTSVVGEPLPVFDARWQAPILALLRVGTATLLAALLLLVILSQRVLKPIRQLAERAQLIAAAGAFGNEAEPALQPSLVTEFEVLRESLDLAQVELTRSLEESRQAERHAVETSTALRQAERIARIGSWSLDLVSGRFTTSDMMFELYGLPAGGPQLRVDDLERMMTPESYAQLSRSIASCTETGQSYALETENIRTDGKRFAGYVMGEALRDGSGRVLRLVGTVQDVSERKEEQARLAALADNLPSGVILRLQLWPDGTRKLLYVSAGIEILTGIGAAEAVSDARQLYSAIHEEDIGGYDAALGVSARSGAVLDHEFRIRTRDGRNVWMHVRAAPRRQSDGSVIWDSIMRDITSDREVADALRRAKEEAEAAERAKSDFLATMSHEIRTPMNSVIGMTRLALQTDLGPRQRNYLEKIDISAQSLLGIINDILDFSKIEAGGLELERTPFELDEVLRQVGTVVALRAEEKQLEIAYSIAADAPRLLCGDPLRLGQVLTNLVGNAVKFTDKGEVVVAIRPVPARPGEPARLMFSVRDSGIGMSDEQIQGLFRPFSQAGTDTSRKYGGTGLGLAICKRLVEMMGGEIWVESQPGTGSTFFFTADLEAVAEGGAARAIAPASGFLGDRRVLIVDDNASARQVLADMAGEFGMQVETAEGGIEALGLLRAAAAVSAPFDIVLLDWRMPGMDGLETARQIKQDQRLLNMPAVLMVTAFNQDSVLQASEEIGLQGVLIKPVTQSVMFNTVLGILSIAPPPAQASLRSHSREAASDMADFAALRGCRVLVVDDNAFNREVASDFLDLVGISAETAVNGIDAIEKMEAGDFEVVLMDMHMPEMDGLTAVREIRKRPEWRDLPVVALTAQARAEDHRASHEAGMTAHLSKPIDEMALYRTLLTVLPAGPAATSAGGPARAAALAGPERTGTSTRVSLDRARLIARFGGRADRLRRTLAGFERDFSAAPARLRAMALASDLPGLAELAHQIKGASGYFDAEACVGAAAAVEHSARAGESAAAVGAVAPFAAHLDELLGAVGATLKEVERDTGAAPATEASGELRARVDEADVPAAAFPPVAAKPSKPARAVPGGAELSASNAEAAPASNGKTSSRVSAPRKAAATGGTAGSAEPPGSGDADRILAALERVEPLISSGDFSARRLLEQLSDQTRGSPHHAAMEKVMDHFDDLDTVAAIHALGQLRQGLGGAGGEGRG